MTVELERGPGGESTPSATVFLTGAECPFTCVFCDLWRYTIDGPTPAGALPAQLSAALEQLPGLLREAGLDRCDQLKLYNASNFFDRHAVPEADLEPIARLAGGFRRVVVECHPRLVDERVRRFADRLPGRLEVAMGLETAHPEALSRLGKQLTLEQFDRAAERLRGDGVDLRVFVLVGVPFVQAAEQAKWVSESVRHASRAGARSVALIPVRGGNGELERLREVGEFEPPSLRLLEESLALSLHAAEGSVAVQVDPWDLDQVASGCESCRDVRVAAIRKMNRTGVPRRTVCGDCG
ncbi:MAG: radical SAM protein [Acidobacteria bacterium]|nr:radical SAM protein [Acidobacteriota bacterium]